MGTKTRRYGRKVTPGRKFGRFADPDQRDRKYLMPRMKSLRTSRYWWSDGWWGDQGQTSQCVAFAWVHWLEDGPILQDKTPPPIIVPEELYRQARMIDAWTGTEYDGTSVRAAAKALVKHGLVVSYQWAFDVGRIVNTVLEVGPVVVGTDWYEGMLETDKKGRIHPSGKVYGGHAYVLDGVNTKTGLFRLKNSWSRAWGNRGFAWISIDDFSTLLHADGEACMAIESP